VWRRRFCALLREPLAESWMSLVGSLEDLGLGDILQIVSLSRKSGLLLLRSEEGEGRIVFCDGLVRAAYVKGEAENLRELLLNGGFITEEAFDGAAEDAAAHGVPIVDILAETPDFSKERIDSLRRERVERSVFRMFGWKTGEFSFEIRDDVGDRDRELLLRTGINAQYLTMEATRLGDEFEEEGDEFGEEGDEIEKEGDDDDIEFGTIDDSAAGEYSEVSAADSAPETAAEAPEPESEVTVDVVDAEPGRSRIADALALAVRKAAAPAAVAGFAAEESVSEDPAAPPLVDSAPVEFTAAPAPFAEVAPESEIAVVAEAEEADESIAAEAEPVAQDEEAITAAGESTTRERIDAAEVPPSPDFASLVLIDPDLTSLEWQKSVLGPISRRIHIFQRSDGGISRVRQYLRRGDEPVVLVSDNVPGDPMSGIADPIGLIERLRAHDPHMPIFLVQSGDDPEPTPIGAANGLLRRPADYQLANRRAWAKLEAAGEMLRDGLRNGVTRRSPVQPASRQSATEARPSDALGNPSPAASLLRLKEMSDRLRDRSVRGEILSLILEFAAESFSRVAIFMVRDDLAVGMAEAGLPRADGPAGDAFREISIPSEEPAWFQAVLDRREGIKAPPGNEGDRALAALLGSEVPREAYVAPVESSHRVVALLYADNLPGDEPIGETTSLEIVLHEAGLALERALLERALADAAERDDA
jgi:hypothetical protein